MIDKRVNIILSGDEVSASYLTTFNRKKGLGIVGYLNKIVYLCRIFSLKIVSSVYVFH